jgi:anti-anti-sigma factor
MGRTVLPSTPRPARRARPFPTTPLVRAEGTRTVVALRGEVDFCARPVLSEFLSRVISLRAGDVVIDLAEAECIDVATVRALGVCQQLLDRHGRSLTFRSPARQAARVLRLLGLSDLIEAKPGGSTP